MFRKKISLLSSRSKAKAKKKTAEADGKLIRRDFSDLHGVTYQETVTLI
jgi:hypothetical protein